MKCRLTTLCLVIACSAQARAGLPEVPPETLGFDAARIARIDGIVAKAIADKAVPGAVVLVGRHGKIAFAKAFGRRAVEPSAEPMTRDTIFDMASLTKPVATATSIMILVEQGKLRLDDRLGKLLPEFDNHDKGEITVEQLLRHRSGLIADNPIADFTDGPDAAWKRIASLGLVYPPGTGYVYSDVGFMILGKLVEIVSGQSLDAFARSEIFEPLGMSDTGFRPADLSRIAPTEPADGAMLRGAVHDPRARALGGVAGHAGLFGTADDLAVFAQTLLDGGLAPNRGRLLGPLTVRAMIDPATTPLRQRRGLGWDVDTPHSAPRGALFGPGGFGHTGFTGTSLWIDPETSTFVIILTSRLHPDGKALSPTALRYAVATVVASSIVEAPIVLRQSARGAVSCGIDVLARQGFAPLRGKRVALVTNHTGLTRDGTSTIDALSQGDRGKSRRSLQPRTRHPRGGRCRGLRRPRRRDRPADLQPLRENSKALRREP